MATSERACGRRRAAAMLALSAGLAGAVQAQGLPPDAAAAYGGRYALRCDDAGSPQLVVERQRLAAEHRGRRVEAGAVQDAVSYLGPNPPAGYRTTLLAEGRGLSLAFVVYRDARGLYVVPEADPKLLAVIGRDAAQARFRDCDPRRSARDATTGAQEARQRAADARAADAAHPLADRGLRSAWLAALGPRVREPWLARLEGPTIGPRPERVGAGSQRFVAVCKPHDCADHNLVLLYDPARGSVAALLQERGRFSRLGSADAATAAALERLWRAEWQRR